MTKLKHAACLTRSSLISRAAFSSSALELKRVELKRVIPLTTSFPSALHFPRYILTYIFIIEVIAPSQSRALSPPSTPPIFLSRSLSFSLSLSPPPLHKPLPPPHAHTRLAGFFQTADWNALVMELTKRKKVQHYRLLLVERLENTPPN